MKKEPTMYSTKNSFFLLLLLLMLCSCGEDKGTSACIEAYNEAIEKVSAAENSEGLLEISYQLHLQLHDMQTQDDAKVEALQQEFEMLVKKKEIEFYTNKYKKK